MKLKHLHIGSYKVFKDFDIDFCIDSEPADIIVIAGVNGTGKTTLLNDILNPNDKLLLFHNIDGKITFVNGYPENKIYAIGDLPIIHKSDIIYLPASQKNLNDLSSFIIKYVDGFVYEKGKTSTEAYKEIQHSINLIFQDFHLNSHFKGLNRDKELIFTNNKGEQFGADGLSAGEKQILAKVFPLFTEEMEGKVVLMDEPEESLHPSWQSMLVPVLRRCAKENDCQFILATHSPQIISSVKSEELRMLYWDDNNIKVARCEEGPYGWTVEKVLREIQNVNYFRVPEIEEKLDQLNLMIEKNEYNTDAFNHLMKEMEDTLGYSDKDLILMRLEMHRQQKKNEKN